MVHKAGKIYDTIFYLRKHQNDNKDLDDMTQAEQADWWWSLGMYYGTVVFLVFYTPNEVEPFDPLSEYTGMPNGDHIYGSDDDDQVAE